ncbi:ParB/RepB/Spo0J family partition protein [Agrobacterium tumefaciens]|uniref:ParB/RepB/Spo0J family partition protein n=1 Tax=Agrobacterium tumefaciens TaxID=358 RepID=A0AA44JAB1_AGRTU|nr:ParB/RepB/Spo0J family partition protein [Agrobacterium tumefaciens]NTB87693.1 ParB/RepB/Spo0J family partition protein [Agrobacterium tumefaciens]NTC19939.1 ParB/RepB/Spo0J family partition protein [Agrobacterium tumefaciens]NTC29758.1 ParB/RepB/Spo0J family partition protein [Agrobacterium tumefaciens]
MELMTVDPRSLKDNPDRARQSKSSPQSDALLCASIKAIGVVQPPVVKLDPEGGNSYIIVFGHRRAAQAVAADLSEIPVLVADPADDLGAMQSFAENIAREPLNPVDQWRAIERLVALGWTEESIALALALPARQIRKLRLLANILPAMLDQMARGDMPNEQQLRTIAAAGQDEQAEVWKKYKPKKQDPQVSWWEVARALTRTRMLAKHASFGDDLAQAYGITWVEDLFAPADEDSRYTTDVEAFLGAQQEWLSNNLPKRGTLIETNEYGQAKLPAKAQQVYGKPGKGDLTGWYINARDGSVQSVAYRMPEAKKPKVVKDPDGVETVIDELETPKARPDVTQKGFDMIGDLRTDALHEALARAPIEGDTLTALLVFALAGQNVTIASGASENPYGHAKCAQHAARLLDEDGKLSLDRDTLEQVVRSVLVEVLSLRRNRSDSGLVARIAGDAIGADQFLPNMASDEFLTCLSRTALEAVADTAGVPGHIKVKDTRAAVVDHFAEGRLVVPQAAIAPDPADVRAWASRFTSAASDLGEDDETAGVTADEAPSTDLSEGDGADDFREAAE